MTSSTDGLVFRTPDNSKWGTGKGSPLNAVEVDTNFWILFSLILNLEANPIQPNQISSISVANNQMTVTMADTTTFGPFTLPVASFHWKDVWAANTAYKAWDVFETNTGLFLVLQDHTSNPTFNSTDGNVAGDYYKTMVKYPVTLDIGFFFPGLPGTGIAANGPIFAYLAAHDFYLKAGLPQSIAKVMTGFTSATSFEVQQNGVAIGSLNFSAGSTIGTFIFDADVQFFADDILSVITPASIDATGANLMVTFAATKGDLEGPSSS
jgi:hypothetical protein